MNLLTRNHENKDDHKFVQTKIHKAVQKDITERVSPAKGCQKKAPGCWGFKILTNKTTNNDKYH